MFPRIPIETGIKTNKPSTSSMRWLIPASVSPATSEVRLAITTATNPCRTVTRSDTKWSTTWRAGSATRRAVPRAARAGGPTRARTRRPSQRSGKASHRSCGRVRWEALRSPEGLPFVIPRELQTAGRRSNE